MCKKFLSLMMVFILAITMITIAPPSVSEASGNLYPYSRVVSIPNPWQIREESATMPGADIFPAFIGSGILGITLDASGNQMLDLKLPDNPWSSVNHWTNAGMYVFHRSLYNRYFISNSVQQQANLMPLGFLRWWIQIDGTVIDYGNFLNYATDFSRTVDARNACVETGFKLLNKVHMYVTAFIPQGTVTPVFEYKFFSLDGQPHDILFKPAIEIKNRDNGDIAPTVVENYHSGGMIYTRRLASAGSSSLYYPRENYYITYGICPESGKSYTVSMEPQYLGVNHTATIPSSGSYTFSVMYYFGTNKSGTDSSTSVQSAMQDWLNSSYSAYFADHQSEWGTYWNSVADFNLGNSSGTYQYEKEFLYHYSMYLDRTGQPQSDDAGTYLSYMMFHQPWWQGANFWDSNFVLDARLKSGDLTAAQNLIKWLKTVKKSSGRPYDWQIIDDGTVVNYDSADCWYVDALYAVSAAKLYRATKDSAFLSTYGWPIIKQFAEWAASNCFDLVNGKYKLKNTRYDVGNPNEYYNDLHHILCVLTAMKQAQEISIEKSWPLSSQVGTVLDNVQLPEGYSSITGREIYRGAEKRTLDGVTVPIDNYWDGVHWGATALALLDLSDGIIIDGSRFDETVGLDAYSHCYVGEVVGSTWSADEQPWGHFWNASSLRRQNRANDAWDLIERVFDYRERYIYGPGFFSEIRPGDPNTGAAGLPPYATAHASYISAMLETFVYSSMWDNDVGIFTMLPLKLQNQTVSADRIRTSNGLIVDADYSPGTVTATLHDATSDNSIVRTVRILMPYNVMENNITVKMNGVPLTKDSQWFADDDRVVRIPGIIVGSSPVTFEVTGTQITSGNPPVPEIIMTKKGSHNGYVNLGRIDVFWNAVAGALEYEVLRSTSASGTYSSVATVYDTSFSDKGVIYNTDYYYKIKAIGEYGSSTSNYYGPVRANFGYNFDLDTLDTTPSGGGWFVDEGNFQVKSDPTQGKVYKSGNTGEVYCISSAGNMNWDNYTVVTKFMFSEDDAGREASLMFRFGDRFNFYRIVVLPSTVNLQKCIGGIWSTPVSASYTCNIGEWYWLKAYSNGNNQYMKIWKDGEIEPAAWMLSTTYTDRPSGKIAVGSNGTKVCFDEIVVIQDE